MGNYEKDAELPISLSQSDPQSVMQGRGPFGPSDVINAEHQLGLMGVWSLDNAWKASQVLHHCFNFSEFKETFQQGKNTQRE